MNSYDVAHRFANKDFGKKGTLKAGSCSVMRHNYYSYSTVFGQWVDMEKNVCVVYWGTTSPTSNKHKLYGSVFPKDVTLFPYDEKWRPERGGYYYSYYHGCRLTNEYGDEPIFRWQERCELMDYWVDVIYKSLLAIKEENKKGLDTNANRVITEYWGYFTKLCSMYKDTSYTAWMKKKRIDLDGVYAIKKRIVKALFSGNNDLASLVDIAFGKGTWKRYYDYCERYRKADERKHKMNCLCKRLGIANPYERWCGSYVMHHDMTADQIRKMSAKERNELHFAAIAYKKYQEESGARDKKYYKNSDNAYRWITGYKPKIENSYSHSYDRVTKCRNMYTGEEYKLPNEYIFRFYWARTSVKFEYDKFRNSEDKEQWIREFYGKCEELQNNFIAIETLKRIKAHTREKKHSYDDDRFIDDEFLAENTTPDEYAVCSDFISRQEKYFADEDARERAAEIARIQREEEERKEKEYMEQVKQEQIDECLERGEEGCRDLWRKHLMDIHYAERETNYKGDFFMGGNVLLRLNLNKDKVESSKHIRFTIATAKAMWKVVSKWHDDPASFKQMTIKTLDGTYTISSYDNDILTAGCHDIAYAEMKRMYNEIIANEKAA